MTNSNIEPAALVFPLPAELREQYTNWSKKYPHDLTGGVYEAGDNPILIPVYPAFPGMMPYPSNYPANSPGGGFAGLPGVNPFLLFLILILLVFAFKKDQIMEAIRKMLVK